MDLEESLSSDADGKKVRVNEKVLKVTGETMLAGFKAEKLIGESMTEDQKKQMKRFDSKQQVTDESEAVSVMNRKRIYERDNLGLNEGRVVSNKVLQLTGDVMLSSEKAFKLLGSDNNLTESSTKEKSTRNKFLAKVRPMMAVIGLLGKISTPRKEVAPVVV